MPYSGGENPKVGDTVKHRSGEVGTVFELDEQPEKSTKDEKIKVKSEDGSSVVARASEFTLVQEPSE
jgi:hypothetical protein